MKNKNESGYKNPPMDSRFKKGQSGNPKGRPKGSKNLKTDLQEELQELILIREGSTTKQVSKQRAMVKSLTAQALKGDTRSTNLILNTVYRLVDVNEVGEDEELSSDDQAILENFEAGVLRRAEQTAHKKQQNTANNSETTPQTKNKKGKSK